MDKISVIIADDHATLRACIRKFLETSEDIRVVGEAENGVETIDCVNLTLPDVLLLDLHMPLGSGLEVVRSLAAQEAKVRVLLLSMFNDRRLFDKLFHYQNVRGYLLKGEDPYQVLQAIRRVASGERGVYSKEIAYRLPPKTEFSSLA